MSTSDIADHMGKSKHTDEGGMDGWVNGWVDRCMGEGWWEVYIG